MQARYLFSSLFAVLILSSCVHKVQKGLPVEAQGQYPAEIAAIMVTKCAIPACHNQASYGAADSLLLDTWEHLFKGGSNGTVVIPYSPNFSTLLYFCNTDASLGRMLLPTMPSSTASRPLAPLTRDEYMTLSNWIKNGAPDSKGNVAFAADPDTRQKIYLVHGSCDRVVMVIDAKTGLSMRAISIDDSVTNSESGHCVKISPDGMYAYVSATYSKYFFKIDTRTDKVVAILDLSSATRQWDWADIKISPDGNSLFLTDFDGSGTSLQINIADGMSIVNKFQSLVMPHGITANATFDTFYATPREGNSIYQISGLDGTTKALNILDDTEKGTDKTYVGEPQPHDIIMSADYSKIFVTCQLANNVKVLDAHTYKILDSIPVGNFPQDMALSTTKPYLFVSCMQDNAAKGYLGSVYVINYNTMQVVQVIKDHFYAPHGLIVDDKDGLLYVASNNQGGASCTPSGCGGSNGWCNVYDLGTLQPAFRGRTFNMFSYPYAMDVRFK